MREVQEHVIGDAVYRIQQLGSKDGRKVMTRVIKTLGPAASAAASGKTGEESIALAIGKLCENLSDVDLDFLVDTFAKVTRFSPTASPEKEFLLSTVIEDHFAGKYGTMMAWLWACLRTNYATFLDELPADLRAGLLAMASPRSASETSPMPPSGASLLRAGAASPQ